MSTTRPPPLWLTGVPTKETPAALPLIRTAGAVLLAVTVLLAVEKTPERFERLMPSAAPEALAPTLLMEFKPTALPKMAAEAAVLAAAFRWSTELLLASVMTLPAELPSTGRLVAAGRASLCGGAL